MLQVKSAEICFWERGKAQLKKSLEVSGIPVGVLLSNRRVFVVDEEGEFAISFEDWTIADAERILRTLRRRDTMPNLSGSGPFGLLLDAVLAARTNDEKKKSLEHLAERMFDSLPFVRCKYRNLATRSSEIDLVCECQPAGESLLHDHGRYFLVECKNWGGSGGRIGDS